MATGALSTMTQVNCKNNRIPSRVVVTGTCRGKRWFMHVIKGKHGRNIVHYPHAAGNYISNANRTPYDYKRSAMTRVLSNSIVKSFIEEFPKLVVPCELLSGGFMRHSLWRNWSGIPKAVPNIVLKKQHTEVQVHSITDWYSRRAPPRLLLTWSHPNKVSRARS